MAFGTLLAAGAEAVAVGVIGAVGWTTDSVGRFVRRVLTPDERLTIEARVRSRIGGRELSRVERNELTRIVDAADNASRRAHQLSREGRLPRPSEIERLPGTGNRGGGAYYYTTAAEMVDNRTGQRRTFTVVVTDDRILSGPQVIARAQEAIASGDITQRMGSGAPNLRRATVTDITVLTVYRGSPEM